jgi:hypothetical protein
MSNLNQYYYTIIIRTFYPSNNHKHLEYNLYSERGSIFKFTPDERLNNISRSGFIVDLVDDKEKNLSKYGNIPNIYLPDLYIKNTNYYTNIREAISNRDNILRKYPEIEANPDFGISSEELNKTTNASDFGIPSDYFNSKTNKSNPNGGYRKKSRRLARKTKRVRKGKGTKRRGRRRTSKLG